MQMQLPLHRRWDLQLRWSGMLEVGPREIYLHAAGHRSARDWSVGLHSEGSAACLCQLGRIAPGRLSSRSAWQQAAGSPRAATQGQLCTPHGQSDAQCWTLHLQYDKATHEAMQCD